MFSFALAMILETLFWIPGEFSHPFSLAGFAPLNIVWRGLWVMAKYCPAFWLSLPHLARFVSVASNALLYGIFIQRSANVHAVWLSLLALFASDHSFAHVLLALPASFAHIVPALAAIQAHHSTIVSMSLANQTGSFSNVFRIHSQEPYLCFSTSLHSEVPTS